MNQSSFSNDWTAGGDNSLSGNVKLNYEFNYAKDKWTWNSRFMGQYGINKLSGESAKKTDDRLEINSVLGRKVSKQWSYSFFTNFRTQFDKGFEDYQADPLIETSRFLSPAYWSFGPGMLWKKSDNLYVNISPATARFTFVNPEQSGSYGVEEGKTSLGEFGLNIGAYGKFTIIENVSVENILTVFTDYLEQPENIVVDYQLNINLKINKYLSSNIGFHAIVDDKASSKIQVKEVFGLGVNISL